MTVETSVVLGVLRQRGEVLLVQNWRDLPTGRTLCWDLPGGGVEPGESLDAAMVRECWEEASVQVRVKDLLLVIERMKRPGTLPGGMARFFFFELERLPRDRDAPRPRDSDIVSAQFHPQELLPSLLNQIYQRELLAFLRGDLPQRYHLAPPFP